MAAAIYDTLSVEVTGKTTAHTYLLRASGSTIRFQGFLIVYERARSAEEKERDKEDTRIPSDIAENLEVNVGDGQLRRHIRSSGL